MTKRLLGLIAVLVLAAACGTEKQEQAGAQTTEGPLATATAGTGTSVSSTPKATAGGAGATTTAGGVAAGTKSTPKPVSQGGANPPKDGKWTYTLSGQASDPFNPTAAPRQYNGTATINVSHKGNVITQEQTNSEQPGRTTIRTRWEATRVLLLSFRAQTPQQEFYCNLNPPIVITKFPIKPETYPTQNFKGEGNACNGKLDITIVRREAAKDANGKSWTTWRAHVKQTINSGQFSQTTDATRWIAPELGMDVRSDGKSTGEVKTGQASQKFNATAKTALKSYPR